VVAIGVLRRRLGADQPADRREAGAAARIGRGLTGMTISSLAAKSAGWRTPAMIVVCGCLIGAISFGPRSALGVFLTPLSSEHGWGRDVFALAIAVQSLLYGVGLPFAGAIADRYGTFRVMTIGTVFYAGGLYLMTQATTPGMLYLSAGVLIGFGLAGSSFNMVLAAFGKLLPASYRQLAFGAGTAAGSFGQFVFSPLGVTLMDAYGWRNAVIVFAVILLLVLPLCLVVATPRAEDASASPSAARAQTYRQALAEAFGHRSYLLLVLGFFTCGFQLGFVTLHLPAYLLDRGISIQIGGWTLAVIGLFNIVGSLGSGWLGSRMPMRYILSAIYFLRSIAIVAFISLPASPTVTLVFGAVMGLLWLSTVPATNGLVMVMFGTRWLAMLFGFAFFSHQVGGFLGVWLGGLLFERTGSYDAIWWLSVFFGVASALINLPIVEKPVARAAPAPV
jgi:MFS family permease